MIVRSWNVYIRVFMLKHISAGHFEKPEILIVIKTPTKYSVRKSISDFPAIY